MNWKRSATGKLVATVVRRFSIEGLRCYEGRKSVKRFRLRIDGAAVGGATPVLFPSEAVAQRAAAQILAYGL